MKKSKRIHLLFSPFFFFALLVGCETPEGASGLKDHPMGNSVAQDGDLAGALDQQMRGPTAAHCPNCQTEGSFAMGSGRPRGPIRGENQSTWNECGTKAAPAGHKSTNFQKGQITGYYMGTPRSCNRLNISTEFNRFLQKNMSQCVSDSLSREGIRSSVYGIVIGHRGITGDNKHSSRSLHAINRAIDIATLHIKLDDGQVIERSANGRQNSNPHRSFYANFRRCWSEKMDSQHPGRRCPGKIPKGSIGAEDRKHRGHIHLSLPHCPSRGYFAK